MNSRRRELARVDDTLYRKRDLRPLESRPGGEVAGSQQLGWVSAIIGARIPRCSTRIWQRLFTLHKSVIRSPNSFEQESRRIGRTTNQSELAFPQGSRRGQVFAEPVASCGADFIEPGSWSNAYAVAQPVRPERKSELGISAQWQRTSPRENDGFRS